MGGQADGWRPKTADFLNCFALYFFTFEPCKNKKLANDEKRRDCFPSRIVTNTSASGEVEASKNMAEFI